MSALAGDLLAPLAPELSALAPAQARAALEWALDQRPRTVVGTHGTLIRSVDRIEEAVRARLDYLWALEEVCVQARRIGAPPQIAVRQALAGGRLSAWPVAPVRHLVNIHAGLAELEGRKVDVREVEADVRSFLASRPRRTR